jgi:hypothetical protein
MSKTLFVTSLDQTSSQDLEGVGNLRWHDNRAYRWVQNKHSAKVEKGNVVFHKSADAANWETVVSRATTAALGFMAGVVVADEIAADDYGWIQVKGRSEAASILQSETTAWTPGRTLQGVNDQLYANNGAALGTAPLHPRHLLLLTTVATVAAEAAANFRVYVNCL